MSKELHLKPIGLPEEGNLSIWTQQYLSKRLGEIRHSFTWYEGRINEQIAIEERFLQSTPEVIASEINLKPKVVAKFQQRIIVDAQLLRGWYEEKMQKQKFLEENIERRLRGEPKLPSPPPLSPKEQKERNYYMARVRSAWSRQNQLLRPKSFPSLRRHRL